MKPTVRRAIPEDAEAILALLSQVEAIHHENRPDLFRKDGTKYTAMELFEIMADESRPIFVATLEEKVAGYIFAQIVETKDSTMLNDVKTVHLDDVCVDESCRGDGIGGALMKYVMSWAKSIGCDRVDLDVWEFNEDARRFYEKYGLTTQKRRMEAWL